MDLLVANLDRLQTCVDQDFDTCRPPNASAVIQALLAGGADPEAADDHGETAPHEGIKGL